MKKTRNRPMTAPKILSPNYYAIKIQLPEKDTLYVAGFNIRDHMGKEEVYSFDLTTRPEEIYPFMYPEGFAEELGKFFPEESITIGDHPSV